MVFSTESNTSTIISLEKKDAVFYSFVALFVFIVLFWDRQPVAYRRGFGVFKPPPEIPKPLQNRAKLNPIVKTVKN
jgi:hypothetical protein